MRAALLCFSLLPLLAQAETLPSQARIVFEARLSGLPVGEAIQLWRQAEGRYQLSTEIIPILGARMRYESEGLIGGRGLKPVRYQESRGGKIRAEADFDWPRMELQYGAPDAQQTATLREGTQELNALPYQLGWLGEQAIGSPPLLRGRKLLQTRFDPPRNMGFKFNGQTINARLWRATEGEDSTEFWIAPQYANLPVKIVRQEERGELILTAKQIDYQP